MSNIVFYKVLLVDDNKALGASLQPQAELYCLDLQQCECWEDAKLLLSNKRVSLNGMPSYLMRDALTRKEIQRTCIFFKVP